MKMHLDNKFREMDLNPVVLKGVDELFDVLGMVSALSLPVVVGDVNFFVESVGRGPAETTGALSKLREEYAYVPVVITSVLPLTSLRKRLMEAGIPYLLHKPDLARIDLSQVRREFSSFFEELHSCLSGIQSQFAAFHERISQR